MSRALDKGVLESLSHGDPVLAYTEISRLFDSPREDGLLLEIEILGKTHPVTPGITFLADENFVGIPKLRLFQAFSLAYRRFKEHVLRSESPEGGQSPAAILRPTAVLLLMDPEHLTAANARKRAILRDTQRGGDARACLERERWFVDSLLTSRLHRHTKSPVLWSHRRWLVGQFQKHGLQLDIPLEIRTVILISGERHPKNYYAWNHARWLVRTFVDTRDDVTAPLLGAVIADLKDWCFKHHGDISGWTFLHYLLGRGGAAVTDKQRSDAFRGILQMAEPFGWRNESVWWFIHAMAAAGLLAHEDLPLLEDVGRRMFGGPVTGGVDDSVLSRKWFEAFLKARRVDGEE